jgi:hypothetical protein
MVSANWTDYCDVLVEFACKATCLDSDGNLVLDGRLDSFGPGSLCKDNSMCDTGLVCLIADDMGVCSDVAGALRTMLEASPFKALKSDGVFEFDAEEELSEEQLAEAIDMFAEGLGFDKDMLTFEPDGTFYFLNFDESLALPEPESFAVSSRSGDQVQVQGIINGLQNKNIKLLAWDWDHTANNEHTFQQSYPNLQAVVNTISPEFLKIAAAWCDLDKKQAIVTYNDKMSFVGGIGSINGKQMIEKALRASGLLQSCSYDELPPVYARLENSRTAGKTWHLSQAMAATGHNIGETLLVDDTDNNINIASQKQHPTAWVAAKHGVRFSDFDPLLQAQNQNSWTQNTWPQNNWPTPANTWPQNQYWG